MSNGERTVVRIYYDAKGQIAAQHLMSGMSLTEACQVIGAMHFTINEITALYPAEEMTSDDVDEMKNLLGE